MKTTIFAGLVACWGAACMGAGPATGLPRSSPEEQGVASSAILAFVEAADRDIDSLHSVIVVRHGHVVAEGWWAPYDAETRHELYSLSKSFTSTAIGLAVAEGKLSVDDEVLKFFPDEAPSEPSSNLKSMRVSDLLRMSTGQQTEPPRNGSSWVRTFLEHPVPFKPGTHFLYNTSATYMLSAIVQKVTGQTVLDYLKPRLFEPLGIEGPTWATSPEGVSLGGYGLSVRTEDIAKFGQLYLQKGKWQGKQLLPESWVEAATARQTSNGSNPKSDWDQGYGYQFWRCRHHAYRGDGAFGQYCIVLPEQDAVIAITSGVRDMQAVLNLVWDKLLPGFKTSPLAANQDDLDALRGKLSKLAMKTPEGPSSNATAEKVAGKKYVFPSNDRTLESITFEPADKDGEATIVMKIDGDERRIRCGRGSWRKGRLALGPIKEQASAAAGAWTGADTYTAKVCFVETPFNFTFTFKFDGDELTLDSQSNVGFGPTKQLQQKGKAE
jgi:CubicO group peptidase (beta-lactamase class C family)